MLVTRSGGPRCGAGSRWQSRQNFISKGLARGERHLVDTPVALHAGHYAIDVDRMVEVHVVRHCATRCQRIGMHEAKLSRTFCSTGASVQICEWQVMQVCVGGIPACGLEVIASGFLRVGGQ